VYCDGRVVVTAPASLNISFIEKFIEEKKNWLTKKLHYVRSIDKGAVRTFSKKDYLAYKDNALRLVRERASHFNRMLGFSYNKINIKNQKTRWGSCSQKKNLNLNYKVLFLPEAQRDYIIVHELCHLKECNHSRNFWQLVETVLPDYPNIKKELRKQEIYFIDLSRLA